MKMVQAKISRSGILHRIIVVAALLLLALTSTRIVSQENKGRIDVHVMRRSNSEGLADVSITLQGPYPVASATALAGLYTPNPALTPEMKVQVDALIASAPMGISPEVIANAATRMEAQLLGLPAPTPPANPAVAAVPPPQVGALTDSSGNCSFSNLAPGRYQLRAQRDGYFAVPPAGAVIGLSTTVSETATVESGQPTLSVTMALIRGATVSGRVRDPNGQPFVGAQVTAYQLNYQNARAVMSQNTNAKTTDDHGEYRLFWLPPGEYYVGVTPPRRPGPVPSAQDTYAKTFFPGTVDGNAATRVVVTEGGEVSGIDIGVRGDATGRITGRVVTSIVAANGQPATATTFYLLPRDSDAFADTAAMNFQNSAADRSNGRFEIRGVLRGSYDLITTISDGTNGQSLGRARVDVGGASVDDVTLNVKPGLSLKARLTIDNAAPAFTMAAPAARGDLLRVVDGVVFSAVGPTSTSTAPVPTPTYRITPRSMETYPSPFEVSAQQYTFDPSGVFVFSNIAEGRYYASVVPLPPNAYIADVRVGEKSVYDDGFVVGSLTGDLEVTVSTKGAKVTGVVHDAEQKTVVAAKVVLVPPPSRRQNLTLYKAAASDAKGNFTITGVAPGEYKLFAWVSFPGTAYMNAAFMAKYESSGQSVTVAQGGSATMNVTVIPPATGP